MKGGVGEMAVNVVYILSDQHRFDFVGYEDGNGVTHTPNLDAMAAEGTVFRQAYCPAPLCSPSRAALASGRYGMNTGCFTNLHELPAHTPTFVKQFRDAGYRTSAVGKVHMEIHAYDGDFMSEAHLAFMDTLGWDDVCEISANGLMRQGIQCAYSRFLKDEGKFEDGIRFYQNWHYFMDKEMGGDPPFVCHAWPMEERLQETSFVGQRAVDWLEDRDRSQPFFLHVGFGGPHSPTEPVPRFMDLYRDADETEPWGKDQSAKRETRNGGGAPAWLADGRRGYRAMISQIDWWIGRIRETLAAQGEMENTVFVYTADHGEMAGDHGTFGKTSFFEGSAHVPLVMSGPGIEAQDSDALVENIDIGKTVCELCGFESHALDQGKSLKGLLAGETTGHRETVYSEMGCDRMLYDGRYKLMWGDPKLDRRQLGRLHLDKPVNIPPSPGRLFDMQEDPRELRDLVEEKNAEGVRREMVEKLVGRMGENVQSRENQSRGVYRPVRV